MPPSRPRVLSVFLGKITRRLSLTRLERQCAKKRGGGAYEAALEELSECVASAESAEQSYDENTLAELLRGFLAEQSEENRRVFLMRYWYFVPLRTIGTQCSLSESAVKARLFRMRAQLRELLTKEGYFV